jgi:hypothetical protein
MFKFRPLLWSLLILLVSLPLLAQNFSSMKQTVGKYKANNNEGTENIESTVLRWDSGINSDGIGLTSGGTFSVAARFTPTELGPLATQGLISVEIYINDVPTSARLVLWGPNTDLIAGPEVYSQAFTPVATSWNTVVLTTPYVVTGTTDLWIGYEVTHTAGLYPCGCDAGPAVFNGDRIYNGGAWDRLSVLGLNFNWNIACTFDVVGPPCPVVPASNPSPANGTTGVSSLTPGNATWTNGAGTNNVEVFFGPVGNVVSVYSGAPITSLAIPAPLQYATTYQWRVVDKNDTCSAAPVATWSFTTEQDPSLNVLFSDDFEAGSALWTITNNPVYTCLPTVGPRRTGYTLPGTGNVLAFDTDVCGSGTTGMDAAAEVTASLDASLYSVVDLEWDNDWQALGATDFAYIDVSIDNGATWTNVKTFGTTDVRNTHEVLDISSAVASHVFKIKLRSLQPAWDWWWVVDNFKVIASGITPVELTSFAANVNESNVTLNWSTATETNNSGFQVERSNGSAYQVVGFVAGHGTTTELQNYSFVDEGLATGKYTYRLKQVDFNGAFEYSNTIETEISVKEYSLGQNYPNPFNPSTKIKFNLAVDSKVSLKIFDVLGQEVATLINGQLAAGTQEVSFNASSLNSGVYFYRIDASGIDGQKFSSVKKMILTK